MGMRISAVTQSITSELRKIDSIRKTGREKVSKASAGSQPNISSSAQKLSDTQAQFATITSSISAQPDIRTEKINEVKQKIENGYYNTEEFIDKLAEKLTNEFGIKK